MATELVTIGAALACAGALGLGGDPASGPVTGQLARLHDALVSVLSAGQERPPASPVQVILAVPGLAIDPWLDASGVGSESLATLLDELMLFEPIRSTTGERLSEAYARILQEATLTVRDPGTSPDPELARALSLLYVDRNPARGQTTAYSRYLQLKEELDVARKALDEASSTHDPDIALRFKVQTAEQRLGTLGRRNEIEAAIERVNRQRSPSRTSLDRAKAQYEAALAEAGGTAIVRPIPAFDTWYEDGGWTRVEGLALAAPQGGAEDNAWRFGDQTPHPPLGSAGGMTASLELKRVILERPWFDATVLTLPLKWKDGRSGSPHDSIPCVPTQLLLARNVRLSGAWPAAASRRVADRVRRALPTAYGPFVFAGRYAIGSGETADSFRGRPLRRGFAADAVQIVGWQCESIHPPGHP